MMRRILVGLVALPCLLSASVGIAGGTYINPDEPIWLSDAPYSIVGEEAGDQFGSSVGLMDINMDGSTDLFVGAPLADCEEGPDCGKVYIFYGNWGGFDGEKKMPPIGADVILVGHAGDKLGSNIVSWEWYWDMIAIAAFGADGGNNNGRVYLLFRELKTWQSGPIDEVANVNILGNPAEQLGYSISCGWVTPGPTPNLVLGTYRYDTPAGEFVGRAYLVQSMRFDEFPATANIDDIAAASFVGETAAELLGQSVASGADLNSDVRHEIILGAPGDVGANTQMGSVKVIFGHSGDWEWDAPISQAADIVFTGENIDDQAGATVLGHPDLNGDYFGDLIVGAPRYSTADNVAVGRVYIFYGRSTWKHEYNLSEADVIFTGENTSDYAGSVLRYADIAVDGVLDLLVGAPLADDGGFNAGKIYTIMFPNTQLQGGSLADADIIFLGTSVYGNAGTAMYGSRRYFSTPAIPDVYIGAPGMGAEDGFDRRGELYIYQAAELWDRDEDSYSPYYGDCDDSDPWSFPDGEDLPYDGVDQDCDGYDLVDVDGDGYDATEVGGDDCLDTDPNVYPGVPEICNGLDDDCDGVVDDGVATFYYRDDDGDGYGVQEDELTGCDLPPQPGYVLLDGDCDDNNPDINPGRAEVCAPPPQVDGVDDDCSGIPDDRDVDGDGHIDVECGGDDCDDVDYDLHPGATDIPYDGIDQDCSGRDNDDVDGDGYVGSIVNGPDCNDDDPSISPGAPDLPCDDIDQNCDGVDSSDGDGDGFKACRLEPGELEDCDDDDPDTYPGAYDTATDDKDQNCDGVAAHDYDDDGYRDPDDEDCDDLDSSRHPSATEYPYDGVDQDCDGNDLTDVDLDGFDAVVAGGDDCDDDDPSVYPGADEIAYDGIDQDCDKIDLRDVDGDGFDAVEAGGDDCNDNDPEINPIAPERPRNDIDENCDGLIADQDGDGYLYYDETTPDCDDTDPGTYPGAEEIPYDGVDQDCDGTDATDVDGDGYDGWPAGGGDCDDENPAIHPGAEEILDDGIDNDCDGVTDPSDKDGDGYSIAPSAEEFDCDDTNPNVYPGALEVPDMVDNNCDGRIDEHIVEGIQDPGGCVCGAAGGATGGDVSPFVAVFGFLWLRTRRRRR